MAGAACVLCGGHGAVPIALLRGLPRICHRAARTRAAARALARADVRLVCCRRCGHAYNAAAVRADPDDYADYDNAQHFSPAYALHADAMVEALDRRHGLAGKTAVEVGAGDGDFLRRIALRHARAIGFDPGGGERIGGATGAALRGRCAPGSTLRVAGLPADRHRDLQADLLVARHVLEHVDDPVRFLDGLTGLGRSGAAILHLEVPNAAEIWRSRRLWDLIPEHVSYFDRIRLRHVLRAAGCRPVRAHVAFGGQFACAEARAAGAAPVRIPEGAPLVSLRRFAAGADRIRDEAARMLTAAAAAGPVAVWGAGSKACTFLNAMGSMGVDVDRAVDAVIDVNPRKQGAFLAGTGHPIVPPAWLREGRPRTIVIANPLYRTEVIAAARRVGRGAAWLERVRWRAL